MSMLLFKTRGRQALLLGAWVLGLSQVGCAQPVVMEPSVVFSSSMGHAPVYAQVGLPGAVVYGPPQVVYAPAPWPRVVYAPPMVHHAPGWGHHGWGHAGHEGGWGERRDGHRGHGDRHDGRR